MERDLIFDVGMHQGEDTAFYLSKGFRVVGIEANPLLIPALRQRFADELRDGRVVIVHKAVARDEGVAVMRLNEDMTVWSTLDDGFDHRNDELGTSSSEVEVETTPLRAVLDEYGVPYFLKIDIEGFDLVAVESLYGAADLPEYVSVETIATSLAPTPGDVVRELTLLTNLGYRRFKFVNQRRLSELYGRLLGEEGEPLRYAYEQHASGPFGEDTPGRWRGPAAALSAGLGLMSAQNAVGRGGRLSASAPSRAVQRIWASAAFRTGHPTRAKFGWYDLHAAR